MSDMAALPPPAAPTETPAVPDLPSMIMSVPDIVWKRIQSALGVKTREEAVELVRKDEQAAAKVSEILSATTALTSKAKTGRTALTAPPAAPVSPAERIYGGGKAKMEF